ncbi:hypothetical protein ACOME3_004892 [Neoechinorhynchus agilis]
MISSKCMKNVVERHICSSLNRSIQRGFPRHLNAVVLAEIERILAIKHSEQMQTLSSEIKLLTERLEEKIINFELIYNKKFKHANLTAIKSDALSYIRYDLSKFISETEDKIKAKLLGLGTFDNKSRISKHIS